MATVGSSTESTSNGTQLDSLMQTYLQTRQPELDAMTTKKTALETKQVFYSNLRNKLSSVSSQIDKFYQLKNNGEFNSSFKTTGDKLLSAKKVTSNNEAFVKATADSTAIAGLSSIRVKQLATNDSFVSKRVPLTENAGFKPETLKYKIKVKDDDGDLTAEDGSKYNEVEFEINFTAEDTNETALQKIVKAINGKSDLNFVASYMKDTSSTGRMVLTSRESGEENQIDLNFLLDDKSNNKAISKLLGLDNLNNDRTSKFDGNTEAKFRVTDVKKLNSELVVNGIEVSRSSNSVDDLLPGVTLNLLKVHTDEDLDVNISTEIDSGKVATNIKNAVDTYNEVVKFLKSDKTMLRSDSAASGLLSQLRTLVTTTIDPAEPDKAGAASEEVAPKYITDLGFKVSSDGSLNLSDTETLSDMLETTGGAEKISHFFNSENGFFARLNTIVESVTKEDGLIDTRRDSFIRQLDYNKKKTDELQTRIDKAAESMRKQYTSLLDAYNKANNQYTALGSLIQG